jgi:hypothetical protein
MHIKKHLMAITCCAFDENFVILNGSILNKMETKTNEYSLLSCSRANGALTDDKTKTNWSL